MLSAGWLHLGLLGRRGGGQAPGAAHVSPLTKVSVCAAARGRADAGNDFRTKHRE